MAIGAIARGDLVIAVSQLLGQAGLYVVNSVSGDDVYVFPVDKADASVVSGGDKTEVIHFHISTDVFAVHTASSISA